MFPKWRPGVATAKIDRACAELGYPSTLVWGVHGGRSGAALNAADASYDQTVEGRIAAAKATVGHETEVMAITYSRKQSCRLAETHAALLLAHRRRPILNTKEEGFVQPPADDPAGAVVVDVRHDEEGHRLLRSTVFDLKKSKQLQEIENDRRSLADRFTANLSTKGVSFISRKDAAIKGCRGTCSARQTKRKAAAEPSSDSSSSFPSTTRFPKTTAARKSTVKIPAAKKPVPKNKQVPKKAAARKAIAAKKAAKSAPVPKTATKKGTKSPAPRRRT